MKQNSKPVLEYFLELKGLLEELNSHHSLPGCTCYHICRRDAIQNSHEYRLKYQAIRFLTGLNDSFSVVRTQVILMDPFPPINRIYSFVVQEESNHKNLVAIEDNIILVNAAQRHDFKYKGGFNASKPPTRVCRFCNRSGHTIDFFYQKHGRPNFNKNKTYINVSKVDAPVSS